MIGFLYNSLFYNDCKETSVSFRLQRNPNLSQFFYLTLQLIPEIRSLSADCLPSLLGVSACGVSARQYFGRSVAIFFHPMGITGEKLKG